MEYTVLLYYKYIQLEKPQDILTWQKNLCDQLGFKGRIIISHEGINATLEGIKENVEKYVDEMKKDSRFVDIHFKKSTGTGKAFPKMSIKVRQEIVSAHLDKDDVNPNETTGKYLSPENLHEMYEKGEEFYVIDMRNDYEHKSGHFKNSILPNLGNFRDLPNIIKDIENFKDKNVVTVCTGGVRCEKASGYLVKKGFKNVSQLHGGIVSYMEKFPNQYFKGKLYVFDQRVLMGFETDSPQHEIVGRCGKCNTQSENYINCQYPQCHKHMICCKNCIETDGMFCNDKCKNLFSKA